MGLTAVWPKEHKLHIRTWIMIAHYNSLISCSPSLFSCLVLLLMRIAIFAPKRCLRVRCATKNVKTINCIQTILNDVAISFLLWLYIFQPKQVWSDTLQKQELVEREIESAARGKRKNVKRGKSYEAKGCDIIIICAWFMLTFIAASFDIFFFIAFDFSLLFPIPIFCRLAWD